MGIYDGLSKPRRKPDNYIISIKELIEEKQKKEVLSISSKCAIYRVPVKLAKEKPEAYIPHLVSIGPFNCDQHHLQPMEARKMEYFNQFVRRTDPTLENYIEAVTILEEEARRCYPEVKIEDTSFAMMMVVDGCFILELLQRRTDEDASPSVRKWCLLASLDLILLENQIPFFVLHALYQVAGYKCRTALCDLICRTFLPRILGQLVGEKDGNNYLGQLVGEKDGINYSKGNKEIVPKHIVPKHLLDFLRQFLIPKEVPETSSREKKQKSMSICQLLKEDNHVVRIRCATELQKAGVKFEKNKKPESLLDIKFDRANGVLTIPGIKISYETELILRNLVVYEQYTDNYSYITEYAAFLGELINTGKDVELLQKSGIIGNIFGDPNEVGRLFNNLLKDVVVPFHYTFDVRREVERHYNILWHNWKANLMLTYFNAPSSFISFVAATILLILTFTQTFYAVKPYIG